MTSRSIYIFVSICSMKISLQLPLIASCATFCTAFDGSMTGDNMKSELLGPPRLKVEGRQTIHRRRMSRNSPLYENGDLDSNLTLAIQESLKCAKQQDLSKPPELTCEKTVPEKEAETPDAQNETKSEKNDHQETTNLRELLLLHLDLIQTQQELLLKKDRELNSLKSEKEAVRLNFFQSLRKGDVDR